MYVRKLDASAQAQVLAIVMREKAMSLSPREWQHRLRGYGYALAETDHGTVITTLPHGVEVCALTDAEPTLH
jgi:hypothetical protein